MNNKIDLEIGLTSNEVLKRINSNLVNYDNLPKTKTIKEIISTNVFTYFNFLNIFLGSAILISGILSGRLLYSLKNCLFMGVIFCNTIISIIQEIISKKIIDKLSVISNSKAIVLRDGEKKTIDMNEIVLNDITILKTGNQVLCDSIIREGTVEVNESFITGESDTITKREGDELLSGSFITSGTCKAEVIRIGEDNYVNKISKDAKYIKENNSVILNSFEKIVKVLGFMIILGIDPGYAIVGYGRDEKKQVQEMIRVILNLEKVPKPDDTADALAMAVCHAHSSGSLMGKLRNIR